MMTKRYIWAILLVVVALILLSCAQTDPEPVGPYVDVDGTPGGPLLVVPAPTITATNTRVGWKPATYVASSAGINHPQSLGVAQSSAYVGGIGQNWGYLSLSWAVVEPTRGNYVFTAIDDALSGISGDRSLMIKIIVNDPRFVIHGEVVPEWAYDTDDHSDNIYMLPATAKWNIVAYSAISASDRVVCSPYNLEHYSDLTAAQKTNFDSWCRNSNRAAGWDAKFREYYGDLMQALANKYDNDPKVSGFIIHGGGDYGESGLMYACLTSTECPSKTYVYDWQDTGNTTIRTMAEIYGVSTSLLTTSCRPDDAAGTFGSGFYDYPEYTYTSCWGRYYAYSIKQIIDTAKTHWRSTPLVYSTGSGIMPSAGTWTTSGMGVPFDVFEYALNCYGDYSVYAKQDGWKAEDYWYDNLMYGLARGWLHNSIVDIGKTVTSLEHGDEAYWDTPEDQIARFEQGLDGLVMFPCIRSDMYDELPLATYASYSAQFKAVFDTYAKVGVAAYVPPVPASCLAGVAYPTATPTATGPTPTRTNTVAPTATATSGGPTLTFTPTSTAVAETGSITLNPVQDSWVSVVYDDYNFGTGTTMSIRHAGNSRPIIQFDLSSIPAGATVNSAELKYTISSWDYGALSKTFSVYTVTNTWTEAGVTWNSRNGTDAWSSAGGDYSGSMGTATISGAGEKTFSSAALNDVVQRWFAETLANNGLMFISAEGDFQSSIWSRESTYKPELIVYYTSPTATPTTAPTATATPIAVSTVWLGRELVTNPGFEFATGDDFVGWTEAEDGGGVIEVETTSVHWGTNSVKLTRGAGALSEVIHRNWSGLTAGQTYRLTFWARGDGTYDPRYGVYDLTNSAAIIGTTSTGITGTSFVPVAVSFTLPAGCTNVRVLLYSNVNVGSVVYFDDVSLIRTDTHAYTATVGQIITYTMYITSSTTVTDVLLYNRFTEGVATPLGATPVATWGPSLNRYYWPALTTNTTPQGFTTIWQIPSNQAPGSQTYRNFTLASKDSVTLAESTHVAIAVASTYTPTPSSTFTVTPTYTPTPTATSTSIPNFYISEVMIKPTAAVYCDWNGDGECDSDDQWIEVYQPNPTPQLFDKYKVRFTATDGRVYTYTIPIGTTVNGYVVLWPYIHWGQHISPTSEIAISTWANVQQHSVTMPGATPDYAYQFRPEGYANVTPVWYLWPSFGSANMVSTPTPTYTPNP